MTAPADRAALIELMAHANPLCGLNATGYELDNYLNDAEAVLTAIEAAGCAVVPVEATEEMQNTARGSRLQPLWNALINKFYEGLVTASPYRKDE